MLDIERRLRIAIDGYERAYKRGDKQGMIVWNRAILIHQRRLREFVSK